MNPLILGMNWHRNVARAPDGEGAGGASPQGGEGATPAPGSDRVSALEDRLGAMARMVNEHIVGQRARDAQQELSNFERTLGDRVTEAEGGVTAAEAALSAAFDEGDSTAIARAQRVLTEAVTAREQAKLHRQNYEVRRREEERRQGGAAGGGGQQAQQTDTTNLNAWKARNGGWYGVDAEMTRAAHEINDSIRSAGALAVGSPEYFSAIDRELKRRFPDKIGGAPSTAGGGASNGGAPSGGGRVAQSVVDGWRRMGLDVGNPETIKRLVSHRQALVDKNILPSTPASGRILGQ